MSRLIDADAVMEALNIFNGGNPHFLNGIKTAKEIITAAPIVDAIPVDWMVQRMNETSSGSGMNVELNNALFAVGVEWERWKKSMARMEVEK